MTKWQTIDKLIGTVKRLGKAVVYNQRRIDRIERALESKGILSLPKPGGLPYRDNPLDSETEHG